MTLGLSYFVKENFEDIYNSSLRRIESEIERKYLINSFAKCLSQRNNKENMIWFAKTFNDSDIKEKAKFSAN